MKIRTVFAVAVIFLLVGIQSALAQIVFSDNFDDGNADGWWLGDSHQYHQQGNWRVENGMLTQDSGGDNFIALVEDIFLSNQTIKTDFLANDPGGYGGTVVWYGDFNNWTGIRLIPNHWTDGGIWVEEVVNGIDHYTFYLYPFSNGIWYQLKVDADSSRGLLAVSVDDRHLFTHQVDTLVRAGRSGLADGNAGGFFDNFVLTSNNVNDVPEASGITLLIAGLSGLFATRGIRRFRRR